jgi:hypothetical protein
MLDIKNAKNIVIEFDIVKNGDTETLIAEWKLLIQVDKYIYLWSKTVSPEDMAIWCKSNGVYDYIWGYLVKDSFNYSKADFVIDTDERFVERFKSRGVPGNVIK